MTWSYSGNPAASAIDKYRFLISDTDSTEPVLQDEEIQFILDEYTDNNTRLYNLFDRAADIFGRAIKKSLGPQSEDPSERLKYFASKAAYYKKLVGSSGLSLPKSTPITFSKGMHDNV